jgi:hypothetical protein
MMACIECEPLVIESDDVRREPFALNMPIFVDLDEHATLSRVKRLSWHGFFSHGKSI